MEETSVPWIRQVLDSHEGLDQSDHMFKPGWKDIFRMNQTELESEIRKVHRDSTLDPRRKSYLIQNLMTSRWIASQQKSQASTEEMSHSEDVVGCSPTFRDMEKQIFGCEHYKRNCKLRAACCGKLFTCRFCHDEVSDYPMDRKATLEMMCMRCLKVQPIGPSCTTPSCNGFSMAKYYCSICKFFDARGRHITVLLANSSRVGHGICFSNYVCPICSKSMGNKGGLFWNASMPGWLMRFFQRSTRTVGRIFFAMIRTERPRYPSIGYITSVGSADLTTRESLKCQQQILTALSEMI
ncbi:hypothetical protein HAX54_013423 [Datura stramonium]|uniref:CHY-type domain-containing protein n=1 Tax=Datura stramonium TaxID=4076 RepID=A0ABS8S0L9_DATST|nr:hypothetical protein [Datura stramonium]